MMVSNYQKGLLRNILGVCVYTVLFVFGYYLLVHIGLHNEPDFFQLQLRLTHAYVFVLALHLSLVLFFNKASVIPFLESFFAEPGSAYTLAIIRILIFFEVTGVYNYELTHNSFMAAFPHSARASLPYMGWLIQNIPINESLYQAVGWAGYISCIMVIFGFGTRFFALLNVPLSIYIIGVPMFYGKLWHMHIWVWFPAILALSRCGDVLSADWLIRKYLWKKPLDVSPHPRYAIPLRIIWLHFGIIYFFAGLTKLTDCGFAWALSDSMISQFQIEWVQNYNLIPAFRIDHYPFLAHAGGMCFILFELFYFFLIFIPAGRVICFFGGITMHNLIGYFMYINFTDLQHSYVTYINWAGIYNTIRRRFFHKPVVPLKNFFFAGAMKDFSFKVVFIGGLLLFSINFLCGLFRVHSWPFSSYPTYATMVSPINHYVYFDAYTKNGEKINVWALGRKANFRMEGFTPIEDQIYGNMLAGDSVKMRTNLTKLWSIWQANVSTLHEVDSVAFYMRKAPVAPEKADSIIENRLMMTLKQK